MDLFGLKARRARREEAEKKEIENEKKRKFSNEFGFNLSGFPDAKSWEQLVVDKKLKLLAEYFQDRCSRQQKLMEIPEEEQGNVEEYHRKLFEAARDVEQDKRRFWAAHAVAKEAGFSVKEKYSDYLDRKPPIDKLTKD